ncbi:MAG TPA: tetratricopeptide repeat protein, partial [Syntrophales bacterium]|nr:tetratricopeptide repeat protein [Syntrophales bacterium]
STYTNWIANAGDYPEQEQGTGWFPSTKARIWPNDPDIFFEMPVHEVADRSIYLKGYRVVKTDIPVHHYGKLCIDHDSKKGERYLKLLERLIEENENDIRSVEEIATQLQNLKRYEEAIKFWEKYLELKDPAVRPAHQVYNAWLNIGHCLYCLGRVEEGLEASKKAWEANPDSREAACNTAVCHFSLQHYEEALRIASAVVEKHPEYPTAVAVRNAATEMLKRTKQQESDFHLSHPRI